MAEPCTGCADPDCATCLARDMDDDRREHEDRDIYGVPV